MNSHGEWEWDAGNADCDSSLRFGHRLCQTLVLVKNLELDLTRPKCRQILVYSVHIASTKLPHNEPCKPSHPKGAQTQQGPRA